MSEDIELVATVSSTNLSGTVGCSSLVGSVGLSTICGAVNPTISGVGIYVPYVGCLKNVDLGNFNLTTTGYLSGILANGVTATTQTASDNSTKVATTAYADTMVDTYNYWTRAEGNLAPRDTDDTLIMVNTIGTFGDLYGKSLSTGNTTFRANMSGYENKVGINTATPSVALDVVGDINSTGNVYSESIYLSGGGTIHFNNDSATGYNQLLIDTQYFYGMILETPFQLRTGGVYTNSIYAGTSSGATVNSNNAKYNTFLGDSSAFDLTSGEGNSGLGYKALTNLTTTDGNTAIGSQSLETVITGVNNTALGYYAGNLTTGSNNIFVGANAGDNLTTGNKQIIIGTNIDSSDITADNVLNIGNMIYGTGIDGTGTTISTGNIGIGVSNPDSTLEVKGVGNTSATYSLTVRNSDDAAVLRVRDDRVSYIGDGGTTNYTEIKADGEINLHGTARVYKSKTFTFNYSRITAQGKPTLVNRGIFFGWSLPIYDSDDEELFTCSCIPSDWDGTTDVQFCVAGWLDTANTDKNFKLQCSVETYDPVNNEVIPITTNDYPVETDTGTAAQYTSFIVCFTLDVSAIGVSAGEPLGIRIRRIAASEDEIAGEFVVEGAVLKYTSDKLGEAL